MVRFMQNAKSRVARRYPWPRSRAGKLYAGMCAIVLVLAVGVARRGSHAQTASSPAATSTTMPALPVIARSNPDKRKQSGLPEEVRRQQITSECADLLKMANDLKTAVDKSDKDILSVTVIRKANEIEQYAHKVRTESEKN